jgi:hypothetical protein
VRGREGAVEGLKRLKSSRGKMLKIPCKKVIKKNRIYCTEML